MHRTLFSFFVACLSFVLAISDAHATRQRLIETIGGEQPIRLQSLDVSSVISGGTAETTLKMVFFNPNRRQLEGNLQFPLADGQQITAFALDINGKLRPAVPVEKTKGRQVFEEIEQRRVDPALLEATQGNNFQLRVYPVPAGGTRTVELKYAEPMTLQGKQWLYRLPLAYDETVDSFSLSMTVNGTDAPPQTSHGWRSMKFERIDGAYRAHAEKNDFTLRGELNLLTAADPRPRTYVQEWDGITYFIAEVPVAAERGARALPKTVGLLWDSSGSGAKRAHESEFAVLDAYFNALGDGEVRLIRLRDRPEPAEVFKVRSGDWRALRKALQATVYDGASALADWKPEKAVDEYLLFSDGLLNYGGRIFPELAKGQRLYALTAAPGADTARLGALTQRSGGRLIQVLPDEPNLAARELLTEGVHLSDIDAIGATDLHAETSDPQHGLLRIAGKLPGRSAELRLTLSHAGKQQLITVPVSADAPAHPLAARFWAGYRLHMLEAAPEARRAEIRRIGQEFGIPTAETSLIVLDRIEDYVRYDIVPPPELRAEFDERRKHKTMQTNDARTSHLENVVRQFRDKLAWWEKSFEKTPPVEEKKPAAAPVRPVPPRPARAHAEAAAPATAPSAPQPRTQSGKSGSQIVVVTGVRASLQQSLSVKRRAESQVEAIVAEDVGRMPDRNVAESLQWMPGVDVAAAGAKRSPEEKKNMGIALKKWTSNAPYIARMQAAKPDELYAIYLDEKPGYLNSSAFFLDAADMLFEKGQRNLALRVLSNLAEMDLGNRHVLRILGYRLLEAGAPELAVPMFVKVKEMADDEPQSFRDLGLAHAAAGDFQQAIDQLNEVVVRPWNGRFRDVELITLAELNAIVATRNSAARPLDISRIDARLLKNMPLDLRVVMAWDADNSDMDLWVTDPGGERCYYGHSLTAQGGRMSADVTQGYGPEEFSLRKALPGKYKVEANFYGNRQQMVAGATTLQMKLTTAFGTSKAQDRMVTLRLKDRGETVFVGEFEVKP